MTVAREKATGRVSLMYQSTSLKGIPRATMESRRAVWTTESYAAAKSSWRARKPRPHSRHRSQKRLKVKETSLTECPFLKPKEADAF